MALIFVSESELIDMEGDQVVMIDDLEKYLCVLQREFLDAQQKAIDIQQRLIENHYSRSHQFDKHCELKIAENSPISFEQVYCQDGTIEVDKKSLIYIDYSLLEVLKRILDIQDERKTRYFSTQDIKVAECQKLQLIEHLKNQVLALNKIVKKLHSLLANLNTKNSFELLKDQAVFVLNNKLPAPDDEDSKRKKLPVSIAQELAIKLDLMDKEMASILTISIRTYHRLKLNGLLNPVASERLMLLKALAEYGLEVFEDQNNFNKWLRLPIRDLSNISPLDSLDTATGFNHVRTVLERIEHGVYS